MVLITLIILLVILIICGIVESYFHGLALSAIPIRIHINGSRGKSSVTRLIASGLRAGGLKTLAKTTGTSPRIIDEKGQDRIIHRLRSASIGEQIRFLRKFSKQRPQAVVVECMAVNPQYQWVSEHKIIQSTISVITNVRPDHLDEMGITLLDNAFSLSNTIPFNGCLVTAEENMEEILRSIAKKNHTQFVKIDSKLIDQDFMNKFPYIEHRDNVALALKVCELSGIKKEIALNGMLSTIPDPGATIIWQLNFEGKKNYFVNLLAANDPSSTLNIYKHLLSRIDGAPVCIFLNTREDRRYRTNQLLNLIFSKIKPNMLIVRGDNLPSNFFDYKKKYPKIKTHEFPINITAEELIVKFSHLKNYYIVGIGNIVGWGEELINTLKEYKA